MQSHDRSRRSRHPRSQSAPEVAQPERGLCRVRSGRAHVRHGRASVDSEESTTDGDRRSRRTHRPPAKAEPPHPGRAAGGIHTRRSLPSPRHRRDEIPAAGRAHARSRQEARHRRCRRPVAGRRRGCLRTRRRIGQPARSELWPRDHAVRPRRRKHSGRELQPRRPETRDRSGRRDRRPLGRSPDLAERDARGPLRRRAGSAVQSRRANPLHRQLRRQRHRVGPRRRSPTGPAVPLHVAHRGPFDQDGCEPGRIAFRPVTWSESRRSLALGDPHSPCSRSARPRGQRDRDRLQP
jgi:hypothetical protein